MECFANVESLAGHSGVNQNKIITAWNEWLGFEMLSNRSQWITFHSKGRLNQGLGTENVLKLESQMPLANQAKKQFDDHP